MLLSLFLLLLNQARALTKNTGIKSLSLGTLLSVTLSLPLQHSRVSAASQPSGCLSGSPCCAPSAGG